MSKKINALIISSTDSVAVATENLNIGDVAIYNLQGDLKEVEITQYIPMYHKFSVKKIKEDENVYKYGQTIGKAIEDIEIGQHVHTHNIISIREGIQEVATVK